MTSMKRTPWILCLLAALALVAAACGGDDGGGGGGGGGAEGAQGREAEVDPGLCPVDALETAEGPVEIQFWHAMTASNEETLTEMVRDYNQSQDQVHVNLVFTGSYDETLDRYLTGLRNDELPQLVQLEETTLQTMIDSGSTVPAAACVEASGFDTSDLLPAVLGEFEVEGTLWPMPFNVSNPVFYYDKNDFRAAGLDPETPPATLDEMQEMGQAIVDAGAAETAMSLEVQPWYPEQWSSMAGQSLVDNNNGRDARAETATVDNDTMLGIFQWIRDMVDADLIFNVGRNPSGADHFFALANGDAAFTIGTSGALGSVYDALDSGTVDTDVEIGVGPLPGPVAGGPTSAGGAALWTVANGSSPEEIAATWDFVQWLVDAEQQARWHVNTGYIPITAGAADDPAVQELWAERPGYQVAYEQLADENLPPGGGGPVIGGYVEFRNAMEDAIEELVLNDGDPAEVMAALQAQSDEAIAAYNDRVPG
jgi:sn-glycerol 3-phosphate transport system substrate-binding protein